MMSDMFRWKNPEIPAELGCFPEMDFFSQRPVIDRKVSLEISSNLFVEP